MKILITGAAGMLGRDLVPALNEKHDVFGVDFHDCDLTDAEATRELVRRWTPDWVINCAAYTAVDLAEAEPDKARAANEDAARHLAAACRSVGVKMLQLSTDYVFSGDKTEPYLPTDQPHPLGVYGRTKHGGEKAVREELGERALIIRTAWLYGPHGKNFVEAILAQIGRHQPLRVVDDQVGSPTYTVHLAGALRAAIERDLHGVYHVTNSGYCTWYCFAVTICELTGNSRCPVAPINSAALGRPAPRPANSRLDNSSFIAAARQDLPSWREGLIDYLRRTNRLSS